MAEFLKAPAKNLIRLPEIVPFDQGAIIADAVATPFHAVTKRGALQVGEKVAVFGCGGLGIHGVQISRICGASLVIAIDAIDQTLERAKKMGADEIINPTKENAVQKIKEITGGIGVDLALEFIGHRGTIEQAIACVRTGGRVVIVGLGPENIVLPPPTSFVRTELSFLGSYGSTNVEIQNVVDLLASGKLDPSRSITERFPLEEVNRADDVYAAATHPVLSGAAIERLSKSGLKKIVVTDTLPIRTSLPLIEVESVSDIFAEAIKRTFKYRSISSLFDVDKG